MVAVVEGPGASLTSVGAFVYSHEGLLHPITGGTRLYVEVAAVLTRVRASVAASAAGQDIIVVINRNGAELLRLSIPPGEPTVVAEPGIVLADTDYLTVDILQVGLGQLPGSGLTVQLQVNAYQGE